MARQLDAWGVSVSGYWTWRNEERTVPGMSSDVPIIILILLATIVPWLLLAFFGIDPVRTADGSGPGQVAIGAAGPPPDPRGRAGRVVDVNRRRGSDGRVGHGRGRRRDRTSSSHRIGLATFQADPSTAPTHTLVQHVPGQGDPPRPSSPGPRARGWRAGRPR